MSADETVRYRIEPNRSRFTVRAFAGGMLSALAHNPTFAVRDFSGEAELAPNSLEGASLRLRARAESLELTDQVSDKDRKEIERLMREQVLEAGRYPEIVFESAGTSAVRISDGWYRFNITGELSLHGVANRCSFDTNVWITESTLRAQGEFPLRQTDYNIKLVSAAGGTIKVKDELKFAFDIMANKEGG
ncbi:MAG TPA: YceI family protein [Blastocatellia bacterium]|jgi:polyisoprenoid-binding protein YceI|nr:YceI family protein [Blastocatellia bacterium]